MLKHQFKEVLRSIFHINHTICCLQLTINERVRESLQWGWVLIKNRGMLNLQRSQLSFFCSLVLSYSRKWGWGDGDGRDYAFETTLPIKNNPPLDPLENCFRPAPALVSMM